MRREAVRAVAICEDARQRSFLVRLCTRLNVTPLRVEPAPAGEGAAEQWVRLQVADEAKAHRSKAGNQPNLVLIVMTDGDRFGVRARKQALDVALVAANQKPRGPEERILVLVPTWSIETWLAWLCAVEKDLGGIDETVRYKNQPLLERLFEKNVVSSKRAIDGWSPARPNEESTVPSLSDARHEVAERIPGP